MSLLREYVRLLLEQQERTLYHGTSIFNRKGIEKFGLQPGVGHFVKSTYGMSSAVDPEDCSGAYDDDCAEKWGGPDDEEYGDDYDQCVKDSEYECEQEADRFTPSVYMADKETMGKTMGGIVASIAGHFGKEYHDVTDEEVEKYGMLVIAKDMDLPQKSDDDDDWGEAPAQAEPGDYYAEHSVQPDIILTGKNMLRMLRRYGVWPRTGWRNPKGEREELIKLAVKHYGPEKREKIIQSIDSLSPKERREHLQSFLNNS